MTEREPQSVLIVSSSEKSSEFLCGALSEGGTYTVTAVSSAQEARRRLAENDFDTVLVNSPLKDEFGEELAAEVAEKTYSGVIMLVKSELYEAKAYKLETDGICCIPKPLPKQALMQSLRLIFATRARLIGMRKKNESLQSKMEEISLVNRAKLLLVEKLGMTEAAAHRYVEKRAMDECVKKIEIARDIIKTYC